MKKTIVFILVLISFLTSFGQNYSPLVKGSKKEFNMGVGSYSMEVLKKTVKKNGYKYLQMKAIYSWGKTDVALLRIDADGNEIYLDPKSGKESINFPINIQKGFSWVSTDGAWSYEIVEVGVEFKGKALEFEDCLVIKATQLTGRDKSKFQVYYNYYAMNVGFVGSKSEKGLMSWITKM